MRRHRLWLLLPLILTLGPARAEPSRANRCIALASAKHRGFEIVSATASPAGNVVAGLVVTMALGLHLEGGVVDTEVAGDAPLELVEYLPHTARSECLVGDGDVR